jgi:hypothetical protein
LDVTGFRPWEEDKVGFIFVGLKVEADFGQERGGCPDALNLRACVRNLGVAVGT